MIESKDPVHDARVMREAAALRAAGHEVSILAWDRTGALPRLEEHSGIHIHRIPTAGLMRMLATDVLRNPVWWRRAYRLARRMPFDAVHCHDLDTLPIGVRLKRTTGRPLVYDCHEIFGYMIEDDVPRLVSNYAFRMERRLAPQADRIVTVTDAVKEYLDSITGKDAIVVRNTSALTSDAYVPPPAGPFTIVYIGDLHPSRFVMPAIKTVGEMGDVRLVVGGMKRLTPLVDAACARYPNTEFLGPVPMERVFEITQAAHAVLAMVDPSHRAYRVAVSTKIYEAMAAGRPSIVTEGIRMSDLVEREACGLAVPYTESGFHDAIIRLRDEEGLAERLGRAGLAAARRAYHWALDRARLVGLYEELEQPLTGS